VVEFEEFVDDVAVELSFSVIEFVIFDGEGAS
jgi:hypothetical protein